jgi:hypothetical protein
MQLIAGHLSDADRLAAGLRTLPSTSQPFAAAQAAWRFYDNPAIELSTLAEPLVAAAQAGVHATCQEWVLIVLDWCLLHYKRHASKADRIALANSADLGYKLLTALAVSDTTGKPLAPVCLELEAKDGIHTSRSPQPLPAPSVLDGLGSVLAHVEGLQLGRPAVYIIDREADSVQHHRAWNKDGHYFVVRANGAPSVVHAGRAQRLGDVAPHVPLLKTRQVDYKGVPATQYVGETHVLLARPARTNRVVNGTKKHKNIPGAPLTLRLIVSEVRDAAGKVLALWLLLTNLPETVLAATIALWYYWRWKIESYHKLLKQAGQQVECWLQDDARQLARRLSVAAMSAVLVWQLARDERAEAQELRQLLVRLSGRLMKRGTGQPGFTAPALLAGLGILLPMLHLLETHSPAELKRLACLVAPGTWTLPATESG